MSSACAGSDSSTRPAVPDTSCSTRLPGSSTRGVTRRALEPYELATTALASVHGVDVNPFAVAIARFRLSVAAWRVAGVTRLDGATGQQWRPIVACGDSLRPLERQGTFTSVDEQIGVPTIFEDGHRFIDQRLLTHGSYHVVVGNPPYITPKDARDGEAYRDLWSACHRQFQLTVPFAQLFFRLARTAGDDGRGAGHAGQITSNAFMKREFGTKLIEDFFPTITLDYVIDTSGAYIPGHGTPTVILIGRRAHPRPGGTVRSVLGVRGEPEQPARPEMGLVWTAIVEQIDKPSSESEWVSSASIDWDRFTRHPWSLSGGGASDLQQVLEQQSRRIPTIRIGYFGDSHADEVMSFPSEMTGLPNRAVYLQRLGRGEGIRDWQIRSNETVFFPYDEKLQLRDRLAIEPEDLNFLWRWRTDLANRRSFNGDTYLANGRPWWEWHQLPGDTKLRSTKIVFAEVATHNNFSVDQSGYAFNGTAPIIIPSEDISSETLLELVAVLNSSTLCFWLKQACFPKGGSGNGGGFKPEKWMERYAFNGTNVKEAPLPVCLPTSSGRRLHDLAVELSDCDPCRVVMTGIVDGDCLEFARARYEAVRARLVAEQEELDWEVYDLYGLLSDAERRNVVVEKPEDTPDLHLGERAFEIVLARKISAGTYETRWFTIHGSTPIIELPRQWPNWYRTVVENRIALIERRKDISLIERPECKRRWASESWEKQQERALETWLLDRLEDRVLWFAPDDSGAEQPSLHTVATLADALRADDDFVSVAGLWAQETQGRLDVDLAEVVGTLIDGEHVPFLSAYRYKPSGLTKRREWERTWDLQRQEDQVATELGFDDPTHPEVRDRVRKVVGDVPVPPKYGSGDFLRGDYWTHRGKLDVAKERFVSYPAASRDGDSSLLLGWAGWDHQEQAQALAVLVTGRRQEDGWDGDRVTPLLAGLAELMPVGAPVAPRDRPAVRHVARRGVRRLPGRSDGGARGQHRAARGVATRWTGRRLPPPPAAERHRIRPEGTGAAHLASDRHWTRRRRPRRRPYAAVQRGHPRPDGPRRRRGPRRRHLPRPRGQARHHRAEARHPVRDARSPERLVGLGIGHHPVLGSPTTTV